MAATVFIQDVHINDAGRQRGNSLDLTYLSAVELRALFERGELSPVEVVEATLRQIELFDSSLNAFVTVTADSALQQARIAESAFGAGEAVPPLAGIPYSLKDLTPTKGVRTTRGSLLYQDWIPDEDAPVASRLKHAGGILLGKTNTPAMGWKGDSGNRVAGPTHNPWKKGRTAGGSSGGAAAAVVSGMGPLAQGSDGAGSIRIPASFSGTFGFKPSWGRVPQYPPSAVEVLSHMGPITRTVADAALMMTVLAGPDERDRTTIDSDVDFAEAATGDIRGLRIGWSPDLGYVPVASEVRDLCQSAAERFEELGCAVVEFEPGLADPYEEVVGIIWSTAFAGVHLEDLEDVRDRLDSGLLKVIERGASYTAPQLAAAYQRRNSYYDGWRRLMSSFDLVLTPTLPLTAFEAGADYPSTLNGEPTSFLGWTKFTYPFNITGQPAATVPVGFDSEGLPVGLQIVGRWRADDAVLRAAAAFEQLVPWCHKRPDLANLNDAED